MIFKRYNKKGQSTLEFMAVLLFLLAAFFIFQKYLVRGFSGRWKSVGESMGQGRIYDPQKSTECASNSFFAGTAARWFDRDCFDANCEVPCLRTGKSDAACTACLNSCQSATCD